MSRVATLPVRLALGLALLLPASGMAQEPMSTHPGFLPPEPEDDYDRQLLDDVAKIGWHHVHVSPEDDKPGFAFSVGFYANYGHPEIIVIGLNPQVAQQLLNIAAVHIAGAQEPYETGKAYNDIAEGMRIAFIPVAKAHFEEYLGYARWFYQSREGEFPALQMVWPDKEGRLPWEKDYDKGFSTAQPLLDP